MYSSFKRSRKYRSFHHPKLIARIVGSLEPRVLFLMLYIAPPVLVCSLTLTALFFWSSRSTSQESQAVVVLEQPGYEYDLIPQELRQGFELPKKAFPSEQKRFEEVASAMEKISFRKELKPLTMDYVLQLFYSVPLLQDQPAFLRRIEENLIAEDQSLLLPQSRVQKDFLSSTALQILESENQEERTSIRNRNLAFFLLVPPQSTKGRQLFMSHLASYLEDLSAHEPTHQSHLPAKKAFSEEEDLTVSAPSLNFLTIRQATPLQQLRAIRQQAPLWLKEGEKENYVEASEVLLSLTKETVQTILKEVVLQLWREARYLTPAEQDYLRMEFPELITEDEIMYRAAVLWLNNPKQVRTQTSYQELVDLLPSSRQSILHYLESEPNYLTFLDSEERQRALPSVKALFLMQQARKMDRDAQGTSWAEYFTPLPNFATRGTKFWPLRHLMIRSLLPSKDYKLAYTLARNHGMSPKLNTPRTNIESYAQAEWTAGWIALSFLDDPQQALYHFTRSYEATLYEDPEFNSKLEFWLGKTFHALKDKKSAKLFFSRAAEDQNAIYGHLARLEEDLPLQKLYTEVPPLDSEDLKKKLKGTNFTPITRLVDFYKEHNQQRAVRSILINQARRNHDLDQLHYMVSIAREQNDLHLLPSLGNYLAAAGELYAPLLLKRYDHLPEKLPLDPALILAVMKKESSFNPKAISRAGAAGLLQLLPSTAQEYAKKTPRSLTGIKRNATINTKFLTNNPKANILLGSYYLQDLIERFSNSIPQALTAYNAGPTHTLRWLRDFGNPHKGEIPFVDWMELVSFRETRSYIRLVVKDYFLYKALLEKEPIGSSNTFSREILMPEHKTKITKQ